MTTQQGIALLTAGALAVFASQSAAALLGAKDGTIGGTAVKVAGAAAGILLAGKLSARIAR